VKPAIDPDPSTSVTNDDKGIECGMFSRRQVVASLSVLPFTAFAAPDAFAELERTHGGRLGVCVLGQTSYRADERFAMCSTFKLLLAGHILARVDRGQETLDRPVRVRRRDLVPHAPVTSERTGATMIVGELCHATLTTSDNPAANLLLTASGGPSALTSFLRSRGDDTPRIDRYEPELNDVDLAGGDERDTTTPGSMAALASTLALGDALSAPSREVLVGWMRATVTGLSRLRAGFPAEWNAGDKTGTGSDGPTNDVAVAWPPGRPPVVVAAYYDRAGRTMDENAAVLAEVGRLVAASP
jgi:beta-lactamase class A